MHRDEQFALGFLCLASLGFYFVVIPWQIEEPDWVAVSPAFLPRTCAILVFVLALYKLLSTLSLGTGTFLISRSNYLYLLGVLLLLGIATFAMYWIGFWASLGIALIPLQLVAGQRNPLSILLFAGALVGASWYLLELAGLHIIAPY